MPHNIVNLLHIVASEDKVNEIRKYLISKADKAENSHIYISFNSLIEMPSELLTNGWYTWRLLHWGTKWDAYEQTEISSDTISFTTAWSGVPKLMAILSSKFPEVRFEYAFADEDVAFNTGKGYFLNGIEHMVYPKENSREAFEIYFLTRPYERENYILNENGEYVRIENN